LSWPWLTIIAFPSFTNLALVQPDWTMSGWHVPLIALFVLNALAFPYFLFLLATSLAAIFATKHELPPEEPTTKFLIAIPAHDEEIGISTTVRSCLESNYPASLFGVAVIADNCTDRTAALAREAGARVVERFDDVKKSKGYAIEFLLESLGRSGELDSLSAVVIVDADTTIDPKLLQSFAQAIREGHDWIQAYYTVANPDQSWRTRLLTYALSLFNGVMQLGQNALGSSAGFKGNGMCFSTRGLRRVPWKSYGLVEDMEYSWILRIAGEKIVFLPHASVYGTMLGSGGTAAANQRRRWEFGRAEVRKTFLGSLLRSKHLGWFEKALAACELTIPSMAVLAVLYLFIAGIDAVAWLQLRGLQFSVARGFSVASAAFLTLSLATYAISPFLVLRLPLRYLSSTLLFPLYLSWKLLVALGGRPQQWVRTAREPHR
jgi:cellulose synthase/poly-beta-1,6-N-acetylglucosamine synthase-like glycosyltransferase